MEVEKIIVHINFGEENIEVGEMNLKNQKIFFKYNDDFIKRSLNISPFKLQLNNSIQSAKYIPFDGLFGVFADSLSDGWGALLLDRRLIQLGINQAQLTPLDKLAYIGDTALGALSYQPSAPLEQEIISKFNLDSIASNSKKILAGDASNLLSELYQLGGSSGGARPKIFVRYNPSTNQITTQSDELQTGYEDWMIKFSSQSDASDIANIEYAYYLMALDAGVEMSICKLFKSSKGKSYFGTKRFDRYITEKKHLHSSAGLMHDDFRKSNLDYGHLMDACVKLKNNNNSLQKIFRLATFNVLAHNKDDHSKNFSFMMNKDGEWQFAPAYDLTFSSTGYGFHSTTVAGQSAKPAEKHLLELASHFKINNSKKIIDQVKSSIDQWKKHAEEANVSSSSIKKINQVINTF